ncbi:S-adenosylmethionine:tRNA ribosyltransferase-isomerase, partial [Streptomyces sp. t39]|uniref:S-adenosylmethionine:tRNA ribosyltransferase-isomerase n=1 Tax=Streptomyces sp. t39 TaxID=1828156 RepID=UPI0012CA941C
GHGAPRAVRPPQLHRPPAAVAARREVHHHRLGPSGAVRPAAGWTDLVVTPRTGVQVVDGLLTGLHEPEASHLLMLAAVAGEAALACAYAEALRHRYLWHEFGDVHLLLPAEDPHGADC